MTTTPVDPHDLSVARAATGTLAAFNAAGVLEPADVHVARRLTALAEDDDERVALALALAVRALRQGSVCLDLATVADEVVLDLPVDDGDGAEGADGGRAAVAELPWPDAGTWPDAVAASVLTTGSDTVAPVLRLRGTTLYLDRYWREERQVRDDLLARATGASAPVEVPESSLDRVFPDPGYAEQRAAVRIALRQRTTVLTGGPGTGKTTAVAALLALLAEQAVTAGAEVPRIALAAPTGKAAARLQEAVVEQVGALPAADRERLEGLRAVTLHRLLGPVRGSSTRFRHHRDNRLPYDVVVVDETSMVSLTMMARLVEAVRPHARLVLVGDPDQLTSVEAGAVLSDLVEGLGARDDHDVARLRTSHRFGGEILRLAEAVRAGDGDAVVAALREGGDAVRFLEHEGGAASSAAHADLRALLVPHAESLWRSSLRGRHAEALVTLSRQRLLCAHREGPYGVRWWNLLVEQWLAEETGEPVRGAWYAGRPVLVTANDYGLGIHNGDTGVCVVGPDGLRVHVATAGDPVDLAPSRLGDVETMHAMTIHKSQGSQAGEVVVLLPPPESRLLTRELLYTAVTRAEDRVVVVGSEADVRAAVTRRAQRATGLAQRLQVSTGT
ncbi:MAG: exodeoxyribonuclease V subunit alpha [Nocardioides sp.]|nr:exodeoxyribonuclease V subunit alpha [Nocardioides sp.]